MKCKKFLTGMRLEFFTVVKVCFVTHSGLSSRVNMYVVTNVPEENMASTYMPKKKRDYFHENLINKKILIVVIVSC
jgi:hypothetical protein